MKLRLPKFLFVLTLLMVFAMLSGCAAQVAGLQELPNEGRLLVLELITAGVAFLLLNLGGWLKVDLRGYIQPIAAVVAPLVVMVFEHFLQMIPSIYDSFVLVLIHYLVLFLGGVATIVIYRRAQAGTTRALLS